MLYSQVLLSVSTRFLGIRGWWRCVHGLRFLFHCGGPVNFQMSSANGLEVAKCQAGPLCSCRVERINSIREAGYGVRWLISFRLSRCCSNAHFHSSYCDQMQRVVFNVDVDKC
jgi:hypothetical protein